MLDLEGNFRLCESSSFGSMNAGVPTAAPRKLRPKKQLTIDLDKLSKPTSQRFSSNAMNDPVEIIPGLFLGSVAASRDLSLLQSHGIRLIVNCAAELFNHHEGHFRYFNCSLRDEQNEDVVKMFQDGLGALMDETRKRKEGILVHCQAGISRSVTIVLAYLLIYQNMSLQESFLLVKSKRPNAGPNKGYMKQLGDLEKSLRGEVSFSMLEYYRTVLMDMGFERRGVETALRSSELNFDAAVIQLLHRT